MVGGLFPVSLAFLLLPLRPLRRLSTAAWVNKAHDSPIIALLGDRLSAWIERQFRLLHI